MKGSDQLWSKREVRGHRRAVVLIAVAAVVMAAAGAAYVGTSLSSHRGLVASTTPVGELRVSYPSAAPTTVPRGPRKETGLVRKDALSILVQKYAGLDDLSPLGLIASAETSNSYQVALLTHELNVLPVFPDGFRSCPVDDGSYFAMVLTYAGGVTTPVKVEATGCRAVSIAGSRPIVLWAVDEPELFSALRGLLSLPPGP